MSSEFSMPEIKLPLKWDVTSISPPFVSGNWSATAWFEHAGRPWSFTKEDIKRIMRESMKRRDSHVDPVRDRETIQDLADCHGISFGLAQKRLQDAIDAYKEDTDNAQP